MRGRRLACRVRGVRTTPTKGRTSVPVAATLSPKLNDLIDLLDDNSKPYDLRAIEQLLENLNSLTIDDFEGSLEFSNDRYQRNYLRQCPAYDLLVVGWKPGQHSTIHDHRGSACGFRVIQGAGVETSFAQAEGGLVVPEHSTELPTGAVCVAECACIHAVSNPAHATEDLVTLHLYAPAMPRMNEYELAPDARPAWEELIAAPSRACRRTA